MEESFESITIWLILAFVVLAALLRSAGSKGRVGERRVQAITRRGLNKKTYHPLHNLTLPTRDGTTQIDHVIVSKFGVFVIETKNLKGWIFGDARSRKWTQMIYGKKYRFQNPLRQNYKHVKTVEDLLQLNPRCVHSVVVFVGNSKLKTEMPPNVVKRSGLLPYVKSKTDVLLSDQKVEDSIQMLNEAQVSGFRTNRRHIKSLRENQRNPICPRCGKAMVIRVAKIGSNAGGRFWGCSGFPTCKATRDLA